jgi:hypothetical protein
MKGISCMKVTWAFAAAVCVMLATVGGCRSPQGKSSKPVVVTTEDKSAFPASLAGVWKSDRHGWEFVFEPDGRIDSAVIGLGRVKIVPGQTATIPTRSGDQAVFTPGPWLVHYDPATRILTVKIAMSHVRVPMGDNTLEGSSADTFSGVVSPAMDTWQVEWTAFTHYTARTGEGKSVDLPTDETYGEAQPLVFTKTAVPPR